MALVVVVDGEDEGGYHAWEPADDGEDEHEEHDATAAGAHAACEGREKQAEEKVDTAHFGLDSFLASVTVRRIVPGTLRSTKKRGHRLQSEGLRI